MQINPLVKQVAIGVAVSLVVGFIVRRVRAQLPGHGGCE